MNARTPGASGRQIAGLITALDDLVAYIQALGVPCTRNPETLQPPAAIVGAPTFTGATLGALVATVPVHFVATDVGQAGIDSLLEMLSLTLEELGTREAEPTLYRSPLNPDGLPAYRVTVPLTIEGG